METGSEEKQDEQQIFLDAEEWAKKVMDYITKEDFSLENYKLKLIKHLIIVEVTTLY